MSDFHPAYFEAAIRGEVERVAAAGASTRNETLNTAAFNLASLGVSGSEIIHSLRPAALQCGLKNGEIYSTINSGMRAGKQHPRAVPTNSPLPSRNVGAASGSSVAALPHQEGTDNLSALPLPTCDAPDKFKVCGDEGPAKLEGELRRHVYQNPRRAVRIKIKLGREGETRWQNWYAVVHDGATGWQAQKPEGYIDIPYATRSIDPFDPELKNDELHWTEGEKDVDTLNKLNLPAFSFGGTGDGLTADVESCLKSYLNGRHLIIYADNDDGGRSHADKKAAFGYSAGAARAGSRPPAPGLNPPHFGAPWSAFLAVARPPGSMFRSERLRSSKRTAGKKSLASSASMKHWLRQHEQPKRNGRRKSRKRSLLVAHLLADR